MSSVLDSAAKPQPGITDPSDSVNPRPGAVLPPSKPAHGPLADESTVADVEIEPPVVADASVPSTASSAEERLELATWQMASNWSMAAALQAKGRNAESYGKRLEQAIDGAELLNVALPELPVHAEGDDRVRDNLSFLLEDAGPRLARELNNAHGAEYAALAELATKTHVLLLSYTPDSTRLQPVVVAIRRAAQNSGLPEEIWHDLVELLDNRAEFNAVKAAVFQLHQQAEAYLSDQRL